MTDRTNRLALAAAQGWRDDTRAGLEPMVARLAEVAANHPDPRCEVHDDDPTITCGWKRLSIDLLNALGLEVRR